VVSEGCNTHTRAETAEAVRSRRASRASRVLGGCARRRYPSPACSRKPTAVDRWPRASEGAWKVSPPGVVRSRLQTPRAGRRRNGGLADCKIGRRFIEKHRPAQISREVW